MISISNLTLTYRGQGATHHALKGVSLSVPRGALLSLLGPSGCGKTTLLRSISGLETPDSGDILIDGEPVFSAAARIDRPVAQRNLGMVFQSYAIWPHMSVFDNAAFPLRYRSGGIRRERVMDCLALVRLDALADRPAPMLSGGQQQRLALARALVAEPKILLLDEPLSNLDARLREDMRFELRQIIQRTGVTTIFVTHEQTEALSLSDTVAVMHDGIIEQSDTPRRLYHHPRTAFVADFLVRANHIPGRVIGHDGACARVDTPLGPMSCLANDKLNVGAHVTIVVKPESVSVSRDPAGGGTVEAVAFMGDAMECAVQTGTTRVIAKIAGTDAICEGDKVRLHIQAGENVAFECGHNETTIIRQEKKEAVLF
jgi:iron(III) transport system ATP-binding protein